MAVADAFEAIGRPYPAAYARFRAGAATLRDRGARDDAGAALSAALATAVRLGARPLPRRSRRSPATPVSTLRPTAARTPDPATDAATRLGLTDRETEILGFIAAGWSNQEIADELFISRKTVSVHASHIFDKLGAGNRSEAAAIAHRLGLDVGAPPPPGSSAREGASSRRVSLGSARLEFVQPRVGDPEMVGDLVVDGVRHGRGETFRGPVGADQRPAEDRDLAGDRGALGGPARSRHALVEPVQAARTDRLELRR